MIAVDTNILIYANRGDGPHGNVAREAMNGLIGTGAPWAIPWPCIHEFLAVASNPRVFANPLDMLVGIDYARRLRDDAGARLLGESALHLDTLARICPRVTGPRIHDARIAAICIDHGVCELWTADRDFSYFPDLRTRNPLVAA